MKLDRPASGDEFHRFERTRSVCLKAF